MSGGAAVGTVGTGRGRGERRKCIGGQAVRHGEVCCRTACMLPAGASCIGYVGRVVRRVSGRNRLRILAYLAVSVPGAGMRIGERTVSRSIRFRRSPVRNGAGAIRFGSATGPARGSVGRSESVASRRSACDGCPNRKIPVGQQDGICHTASVLSCPVLSCPVLSCSVRGGRREGM